jgi:hypothetical protein
MEESEFLEIEDELRTLCATIGALEVLEDRYYFVDDGTEGSVRLLDPRRRVLAQLDALDRFLCALDGSVYQSTMETIQGLLSERSDKPSDAVLLLPERSGTGAQQFDFRQLPNLKKQRAELTAFRNRLAEA